MTWTGLVVYGWGRIHADNITTQQPPSPDSTSTVKTQPVSHRGPNVPQRHEGMRNETPSIQHDDVGLILIPHLREPEPRRQRTLPEGGEFWALSYTWSRPSLPPSFSYPFWDTSQRHNEAGQSLHLQPAHHCLHQMETDTSEDTASTKTEVVTDRWCTLILTRWLRSHFFKKPWALPVLLLAA